MTMSTSSGHSARYLTGQVAVGRESYYLNATTAGEPPGKWWGTGAAALGLEGQVDNDAMEALYSQFLDPRDPRFADPETRGDCRTLGMRRAQFATADEMFERRAGQEPGALPERLAQIRAECEQAARQSVAFVDCTFSPAKSVTVLHTAYARAELDAQRAGDLSGAARWAAHRVAVEEAIWEGNRAMLEHLSERAGFARTGRHGAGAGRFVDAHDWTVASFFQHTSRDLDPQLHIHNAVLNRVVCDDSVVRTLDSRAIHRHKQGAGTIGDRAMEQALSSRLGVRWVMRADGVGREIDGVTQQQMDTFSSRAGKITRRHGELIREFGQRVGREPSGYEVYQLRQQAAMATRRSKTHDGETREQQIDRWKEQWQAQVATRLHEVTDVGSLDRAGTVAAEAWSPAGVKAEAVAAAQAGRAAFGRSELTRQILLALPDNLGGLTGGQVRQLADRLTDEAVAELVTVTGHEAAAAPVEFQKADGTSVYLAPGGPRYATRDHVVAEQALRRAAVERGRSAADAAAVDRWLAANQPRLGLSADQAAAVRGIVTSGAAISVLVGPAGTGKSYTLGAVSQCWSDLTGGRVMGLATSEIATQVLRDDGLTAKNTAQWLAAQQRLDEGRGGPTDRAWQVRANDLVVVDEASMVNTTTLGEIRGYVERAGARIVPAGDPGQLGAIGAGGAMEMLAADETADVHTLAEVRRFRNDWEGRASLRLRDGDKDVIGEYDRRGRVMDAGTAEQAVHQAARAYLGDSLAGKSSMVFAASNEQAAQVAATIRDELVALGRVAGDGVMLGRDGNVAGVGDLVQARRLDRSLGVLNRGRYTVREVQDGGGLVVEADNGARVILPAAYVAEDLALGYASTVHAGQGVTLDTSHAVVTSGLSREHLYVGLSRGRDANTAHVATQPEVAGESTGETHQRARVTAPGVLADILTGTVETERATELLREESLAEATSLKTIHARYEDAIRVIGRERTRQWLDQLTADGTLSPDDRQALAADQGVEQLGRLLRTVEQAGGDPEQALRDAVSGRSFEAVRSHAQVLHHRIGKAVEDLTPKAEHMGDGIPADLPDGLHRYLEALAEAGDSRRRELAATVAETGPQWAVETLGPVPDEVVARAEWEHRAGLVAAYREAADWTDEAEPLGPSPGLSATEKRAAWHSAWSAIGRPEATPEEHVLSEGALRCRVKAGEREHTWQPPYVDAEMRATGQEVQRHRQDAAILQARAEQLVDEQERARVLDEAAETAAMADRLAATEAELAEVAEQRARWIAETAVTRDLALRASMELEQRGVVVGQEPDRTTAEEWLRAEQVARVEDDEHRPVTEADVAEPDTADTDHGRDLAAEDRAHARDLPAAEDEPSNATHVSDLAATDRNHGADLPADEQVNDAATASNDAVEQSSSRTITAGVSGNGYVPVSTSQPVQQVNDAATESDDVVEQPMPAGVPSTTETEAAALAAQTAAAELADRASQEQAHRAVDDVEQASREQAWRDADTSQAEQQQAADADVA